MRAVVPAAVAVATLLAVAAPAGAVAPPTGDPGAIALYRRQALAYARVPAARIVETGYYFVRPGAGTSVAYWWGSRPPAGYVPARATIVAHLSRGKIVAYLADLRASGVRRLRIVMGGGAVFTSTASCWRKTAATASPLGTGERFLFNDGGARFTPASTTRDGTAVTFSYGWGTTARATETDTFGAGKPPPVRITITVSGPRPVTVHESILPLAKSPRLPIPPPPARPAPKHLCT